MSKTRKIILLFLVIVFAAVGFSLPASKILADDEDDIRDDISDISKDIQKEEVKLNQYNSNLSVTQSQINTTSYQINETEKEINEKERKLMSLEDRIELNKKILTAYAQKMYFSDQETAWVLNFSGQKFNEYFKNFDQIANAKEKMLAIMEEIKKDKEETENVKEELAEKKEEHEVLLNQKYSEKNKIVSNISETQLTISQLQAKLSKLRSRLSSFLGEDFSMDDVIDAVKYADKKTGVRKEFLFAVLDKESDLGRFTGGCSYKKSKMGDTNLKYFKEICDDLGYNYKKMKVSCPLSYGIGGAMGIAQFMPSTWMGYKDKIAAKTGNDPADPWDLEDGIMGMALYLKNKGGDKKSGEHTAAAAYYCGSNLSRAVCQNYADTVISWSKGYDDYF